MNEFEIGFGLICILNGFGVIIFKNFFAKRWRYIGMNSKDRIKRTFFVGVTIVVIGALLLLAGFLDINIVTR